MEKHTVKILNIQEVTHNVKRFELEKPAGYTFIPGQATDVSINLPELENELRPFTFTSLNEWDHLEFTIKIYKGHEGITEKLGSLKVGDELIIHEVFGTIQYKGPGVFIAGGAGITPFISIFRQLQKDDQLAGNTLLFANHNENDIIYKTELNQMLGQKHIDVLSDPIDSQLAGKSIDAELLTAFLGKPGDYWYICGPDAFTKVMIENLESLGIRSEQIIIEQ